MRFILMNKAVHQKQPYATKMNLKKADKTLFSEIVTIVKR